MLACATMTIAALPALADVVFEYNENASALEINTTDSTSSVLINGVDVVSELSVISKHVDLLTAATRRVCAQSTSDPVTEIPVSKGPDAFAGTVLGPDGLVYGIPYNDDRVLVFNPETRETSFLPIPNQPSNTKAWQGGVAAPNGKIFGIPSRWPHLLMIDTTDGTVNATLKVPAQDPASTDDRWLGGVYSPDSGLIYGIPHDANTVLIIDPDTGAMDATTLTISGDTDPRKWWGGVLANDGNIYCVPHSTGLLLVIDPVANAVTEQGPGISSAGNKWAGGVLGPDGLIYCIPHIYESVLVIQTQPELSISFIRLGTSGSVRKWVGGVLAFNNLIYAAPSANNGEVLVLDPLARSVDLTSVAAGDGSEGLREWEGMVSLESGLLVSIPRVASSILIIDPRCMFSQ